MSTLVIVHVEPDFLGSFELTPLIEKEAHSHEKIINITSAESLTGTLPYPEIEELSIIHNVQEEEWIWGIDIEGYISQGDGHLWREGDNYIRTTDHEYSEILDWMKDLPKDEKYFLCGGGRNECLQDVHEIFNHLELSHEILEHITY